MGIKKIDKSQLIETAGNLFRTRGYCNTSMADIAGACSINKASLYHHFPSKKDLTVAVLKNLHDYFKEHFFVTVYQETVPPLERLTKFTQQIEDFFLERESGCLMANLTLEVGDSIPEFAQVLKAYFNDWISAISHVLVPRYSQEQAKNLAADAVSQIQGAIMLSNLYGDYGPLKRQRLNLLSLLSGDKAGQMGRTSPLSA